MGGAEEALRLASSGLDRCLHREPGCEFVVPEYGEPYNAKALCVGKVDGVLDGRRSVQQEGHVAAGAGERGILLRRVEEAQRLVLGRSLAIGSAYVDLLIRVVRELDSPVLSDRIPNRGDHRAVHRHGRREQNEDAPKFGNHVRLCLCHPLALLPFL